MSGESLSELQELQSRANRWCSQLEGRTWALLASGSGYYTAVLRNPDDPDNLVGRGRGKAAALAAVLDMVERRWVAFTDRELALVLKAIIREYAMYPEENEALLGELNAEVERRKGGS